uniref:Uncharacterized protein n=1 Tax=Nelumbo nucifera TaxID=4432 RepID=A0A822YX41_NELNU|nr:TPA_asm: hypothetical protein HUJ06_007893 [Nelumbo nucifera]
MNCLVSGETMAMGLVATMVKDARNTPT